jgi:hypothetical protein
MHKHSSGMQSLSWSETADTETWTTIPQALIAHTSKRQFAWIGMELVMDSIKQNTYIAGDLIHTQTNKQTNKKKKGQGPAAHLH